MKRLCLLFALVLAFMALPAQAEEEAPEELACGDWYYTVREDGSAEIVEWSGIGDEETLTVPDALEGHPVCALGDYALAYWDALKEIVLPEGIERIGSGAFAGCVGLERIALPGSVVELGANPFEGCGALDAIDLAEAGGSLTFDGGMLMDQSLGRLVCFLSASGIKALEIPEGTRMIGSRALYECGELTSVSLPRSLEVIGESAFAGCAALEALAVPDGTGVIGESAFADCAALKEAKLPEGLEVIPPLAFSGCAALEAIRIPEGVREIGEYAFDGCEALAEARLPESLESLGSEAFGRCASLRSVALPTGVIQVGANPFIDCVGLSEITVSEDSDYLSTVDGALFADGGDRLVCWPQAARAETCAVPEGTKRIGEAAFYCCGRLINVRVPQSVQAIGERAFDGRGNLTLTVDRRSFAEAYAVEKGIKYTYPDADEWLKDEQ